MFRVVNECCPLRKTSRAAFRCIRELQWAIFETVVNNDERKVPTSVLSRGDRVEDRRLTVASLFTTVSILDCKRRFY